MSSIKSNNDVVGNQKNNTLKNKKTGMTALAGYGGNDTYVINNLSKSYIYVIDTSGKDSLHIKNIDGNKLIFYFNVSIYDNDENDELEIISKNKAEYVITQMKKWTETFRRDDFPKGGEVWIRDYFGNTNDIQYDGKYGTVKGDGYIENIYSTSSTGVKYSFNLNKYISDIRAKIIPFLKHYGYSTNRSALLKDTPEINELINIYNNTPINMKITGSKKADKIFGGNGKDKIKANAGNDVIKAAGGNDIIKGEKGNDKIYAGAGNDKIYGGKGNDTINAGTGNNNIYIAKNDGNDIILNGKGSDTLIFSGEKFKNLKAKFVGSNLVITHSGGKVTLKNYKKVDHSVEFIKAGKTTKAITSFFPAAKKYADVPTTSTLAVRAIQANVASWVSSGDDLASVPAAINDPIVNNATLATFVNDNFNQINPQL